MWREEEILKFKIYYVKVSNVIRIAGEEEACAEYQELDV